MGGKCRGCGSPTSFNKYLRREWPKDIMVYDILCHSCKDEYKFRKSYGKCLCCRDPVAHLEDLGPGMGPSSFCYTCGIRTRIKIIESDSYADMTGEREIKKRKREQQEQFEKEVSKRIRAEAAKGAEAAARFRDAFDKAFPYGVQKRCPTECPWCIGCRKDF